MALDGLDRAVERLVAVDRERLVVGRLREREEIDQPVAKVLDVFAVARYKARVHRNVATVRRRIDSVLRNAALAAV